MNTFRTVLQIPDKFHFITHQTPIFSIGSCFAEAIGNRLSANKFQVLPNPFGTIFSPMAIFKIFKILFGKETVWSEGFIENPDKIWYHYDFHSSLRATQRSELESLLKNQILMAQDFLEKTKVCIITLGTAWAYQHIASHRIVANCHKMPQHHFEKILISVEEICKEYDNIAPLLGRYQIILTVSPVRHLKDTLPLNAVSKSVLRLACHYLQEKHPNTHYFPAFEFVNDDLRDYRFYAEDMLHINPQAEDYIWQHFVETFISPSSQDLLKKWAKISRQLHHKPFLVSSEKHQIFLKKLQEELLHISQHIDVKAEMQSVREQLLSS
jgi:hypothetical protein